MVVKGKERQTHVGEDKVLCQKVDEFKEVLGPSAGLLRQIDEGVIGLHYTTE